MAAHPGDLRARRVHLHRHTEIGYLARVGDLPRPAEAPIAGLALRRSVGINGTLGGLGLMVAGGWLAVGGAERVVAALGISDSAAGLTLLALATTAELFALAWAAMRRGVAEAAVAGVVGSVAYNATATLGAAALVQPLAVGGLLWPAIAAGMLPLVLLAAAPRGRLGRWIGALLITGYPAWVTALLAH